MPMMIRISNRENETGTFESSLCSWINLGFIDYLQLKDNTHLLPFGHIKTCCYCPHSSCRTKRQRYLDRYKFYACFFWLECPQWHWRPQLNVMSKEAEIDQISYYKLENSYVRYFEQSSRSKQTIWLTANRSNLAVKYPISKSLSLTGYAGNQHDGTDVYRDYSLGLAFALTTSVKISAGIADRELKASDAEGNVFFNINGIF